MASQTPTIDSQVHVYEKNRPERPWSTIVQWPDEVTGDDMVAAMDAVGIDGALLISPFSMYRYDASYALEVYATHPDRFGLIKPFDPQSEAVADEIAEWAGTPGVVGARIMLTAQPFEADDPGLNRILAAGAQAGIPVNVMCSGKLPLLLELARRHPDTQVVVDHVGLIQPPRATSAARTVRRFGQRGFACGMQQRGHQDFWSLYPIPSAIPVPGHLGASEQGVRRFRFRPMHVGYGLDARNEVVDLRAGRSGVSGHGSALGFRAFRPHGRDPGEDLQLVA